MELLDSDKFDGCLKYSKKFVTSSAHMFSMFVNPLREFLFPDKKRSHFLFSLNVNYALRPQ